MTGITFFADFSNQNLVNEIPRIREITNNIIYTAPTGTGTHKKDFTDFIMLDCIYQKAMSAKDLDAYIIFSGDGHFSSVVSFLTNTLHKEVGVYGVGEALSSQLRNIATWVKEVPSEEDIYKPYIKALLDYIKKKSGFKVTAKSVIDGVCSGGKMNRKIAEATMKKLSGDGYIQQKRVHTDQNQTLDALFPDWDRLEKDGIWAPETETIDEGAKLRKMIGRR